MLHGWTDYYKGNCFIILLIADLDKNYSIDIAKREETGSAVALFCCS